MGTRAVIYARISEDAQGDELGVRRQQQDCEALAKDKGYTVVETYIDNDVTAAGQVKKERPEWNRMLMDAKSNAFDVILAYSNSRLTRRLVELETLIQLHDQHNIRINTVVSGDDNMATADGRMVARIKASVDAAEAERVGERVSRAARQRAENGLPQKGRHRLFGYNADWTVNKAEAEFLVEAFERRAKGESTTAICKDFSKRGIKTVAGNNWNSGTLGTTLTKPVYCGLIAYKGEIVSDSAVPALVDKPLWDAAQKELAGAKRGTNTRKYLLSGFLICSYCSTRFKGSPHNKMYRCSTTYGGCGKLSIRIELADSYVYHAAMSALARQVGNAREGGTPRDYAAEIADVEDEIARLQEGFRARLYEPKEVQPLIQAQRALKRELERQAAINRPRMPKIQRAYLNWHKMDLSQKRAFLDEYIDHVVIHPAISKGNQVFDPGRMEVVYTDGWRERLERELEDPTE